MLRVALTGGIATGKSYVRARVEARGIPTIDSDQIVHSLLAAGTPVAADVARRFGPSALRPDGTVDRAALGRLVFSDGTARTSLEQIVHPRVYGRIDQWAGKQERLGARWVLADIPLLFETGHQGEFDRVIVTACEPELQLHRLMARGRMAESEARARLAAQWPVADKARLADYLVTTDGSFEETDRQVDAVITGINRELENLGMKTENRELK